MTTNKTQDATNIFLDWFIALLRNKKLIVINTVLALLITYGITRLLPVWFTGQATILPPYNRSATIPSMGGLGGMLGISGSGGDFNLPLMATQTDLWAAIVKSPALLDTIIINENLMERYESESLRGTRKKFKKHIDVEATKEGILSIKVEDQDPEFAAYLANKIVKELDRVIISVKTSVSGNTREFLEHRLIETRNSLSAYEDSLAVFQREHGAIAIEDQAKVIIESAAQIQAELLMTDIELGIAQKSYTKDHSRTLNLKSRKDQLEKQLHKIEYGNDNSNKILNIPLNEVPELALEYARLMRETTAREVLYSFILQQYEQAKIDEKKDTPTMQVLSKAIPRDKKSRPKRSLISAISAFLVMLFTCAFIIISTFIDSLEGDDPEKHRRLTIIKKNLFSWKFKD